MNACAEIVPFIYCICIYFVVVVKCATKRSMTIAVFERLVAEMLHCVVINKLENMFTECLIKVFSSIICLRNGYTMKMKLCKKVCLILLNLNHVY